jgi:hypothetical protein
MRSKLRTISQSFNFDTQFDCEHGFRARDGARYPMARYLCGITMTGDDVMSSVVFPSAEEVTIATISKVK